MKNTPVNFPTIISEAAAADVSSLREFFFSDPSRPLVATGSGGAEAVGDFAALLYGARGGMSLSVSPYTLNSFSDSALSTSKVLLVSKGGHNNDIIFAAKRSLSVNPSRSASFTLYTGEKNEVRKLFLKAGSTLSFDIPDLHVHDGFVSTESTLMYFALLCRVFDPDCDLRKYSTLPEVPYKVELNDGTPLSLSDLHGVNHFVFLHGSWGRPVSKALEGKFFESGMAPSTVVDLRNYCHGRFIFTSNHLEESAVVFFVSPREKDLVRRVREFLPPSTKIITIETESDSPEASLDQLIRSNLLFTGLCEERGVDFSSPSNKGRIDKRKPMWIPFMSEMKKNGPLALG